VYGVREAWVMSEREIEAVARASSALDEVVAYFDDGHRLPPAGFPLASVVRPAAEGLRAALDRVRDARGDDEAQNDLLRIRAALLEWEPDRARDFILDLTARRLWPDGEPARSPQDEDHER
jgi:hypothetical protein